MNTILRVMTFTFAASEISTMSNSNRNLGACYVTVLGVIVSRNRRRY